MSSDNIVKTDIGMADKLTMDDFVRTLVAQMFENDNDTATLDVTLNGTDAKTPPKLELEITLKSINGVATRSDS